MRTFEAISLGAGFTIVFPMATTAELGQGKLQLGPTAVVYEHFIPSLAFGALVTVVWSVAGSSQQPDIGHARIEPLLQVSLPADLAVFSNAALDFYWHGGRSSVPLNLGIERDFGAEFIGQLQCAYVVWGLGKGSIQSTIVLDFQR